MNLFPSSGHPRRVVPAQAAPRGFTLIELLVVISIIGVLAGLVVGLAGVSSRAAKEARTKAELAELVTAIEAYKAQYNMYPPDNPTNAAVNPLFYELSGVVTTDGLKFATKNNSEVVPQAAIRQFFGQEGIVNAARRARDVKSFANFRGAQYAEVSGTPDVEILVCPIPWPANVANPPIPGKPLLNPWRYVSTQPTNNPTRFDLWTEIIVGKKRKIISNW